MVDYYGNKRDIRKTKKCTTDFTSSCPHFIPPQIQTCLLLFTAYQKTSQLSPLPANASLCTLLANISFGKASTNLHKAGLYIAFSFFSFDRQEIVGLIFQSLLKNVILVAWNHCSVVDCTFIRKTDCMDASVHWP